MFFFLNFLFNLHMCLKISLNYVRLILKDEFGIVHIPLVRLAMF